MIACLRDAPEPWTALHDKPLVWPAALTDCTQM